MPELSIEFSPIETEARIGGERDDDEPRGPWPYDVLWRFVQAHEKLKHLSAELAHAEHEHEVAEQAAMDLLRHNKHTQMVTIEDRIVRLDNWRSETRLTVFRPDEVPSVYGLNSPVPLPEPATVEDF